MHLLFSVVCLMAAVSVLFFIYSKYKTDDEKLLAIKLIGYYILGAFRFNINKAAIPLGFIIFVLFFRPAVNAKAKKIAAYTGVVVFAVSLAIPWISGAYFERTRETDASGTNLYKIEFSRDLDFLDSALNLQSPRLDNFNAEFNRDGAVRELRFDLLDAAEKGYVLYHIRLSAKDCKYRINPVRVEEWIQYPELLPAQYVFETLDSVGLDKIKPEGSFDFYTLNLQEHSSYAITDRPVYLIQDSRIEKADTKQFPIEANSIILTGMEKTSPNSWEGKEYVYYLFR